MCRVRVLCLAAGALIFGVHIEGASAATALATEESQAEAAAGEPGVAQVAYARQGAVVYRRKIDRRQRVTGQRTIAPRGYYGAARPRADNARRFQRRQALRVSTGPAALPARSYPVDPLAAYGSYGTAPGYPQYDPQRYSSVPPFFSDSYSGLTGAPLQTYSPRSYAGRPVVAAPRYFGAGYAVAAAPATGPSALTSPGNVISLCVNGRICTGYSYYRGAPVCRMWAACNY